MTATSHLRSARSPPRSRATTRAALARHHARDNSGGRAVGNGGDGGARADEDGDAELAEACNVLSELPSSPAARIALAAVTATRGEPAAGLEKLAP